MNRSFERFTDPAYMAEVFQQEWAGETLRVTHCDVLHARYRGSTRRKHDHKRFIGVMYQLWLRLPGCSLPGRQLLYAKAYANGASQAVFQKTRQTPVRPAAFGRPLVHIGSLDMVVWAFPNDPGLPALADVIDPQRVVHHLPYRGLPIGLDGSTDAREVTVEVVHYHPEERCVSRLCLIWGTEPRTLRLVGKTYAGHSGEQVYQRMRDIWNLMQRQAGGFDLPQPLGYCPEINTLWLPYLPGEPLSAHLRAISKTSSGF